MVTAKHKSPNQKSSSAVGRRSSIPHGFYSYESALLAADILKEKISNHCMRPPKITGDLSERKGAVNKIEITCIPMPVTTDNKKELFPKETNAVIEYLRTRYNLECTPGRATFNYMTIPTTIHFNSSSLEGSTGEAGEGCNS